MISTSPRRRRPEAFAAAVERWPADGIPPTPGAWLSTTANRKAIDRIRRENKREDKHREAQMVYDDDPPEPAGAIDDDRLRLIFTCCHPALAMQTRVALTLRMVGGLTAFTPVRWIFPRGVDPDVGVGDQASADLLHSPASRRSTTVRTPCAHAAAHPASLNRPVASIRTTAPGLTCPSPPISRTLTQPSHESSLPFSSTVSGPLVRRS